MEQSDHDDFVDAQEYADWLHSEMNKTFDEWEAERRLYVSTSSEEEDVDGKT